MMNIPDTTKGFIQELEKKLFDFLWNGKKDKMKEALSSFWARWSKNGKYTEYLSAMKINWLRQIF